MPPKMRLPQKPEKRKSRRSRNGGEGRGIEARASSVTSPPATSPRTPVSAKHILSGRTVDMEFLDSEKFQIAHLIRNMGWEFICTAKVPIFMELVREFYQNISFQDSTTVSSSVKNKEIIFDDGILGEILRLQIEGDLLDGIEDRSRRIESVLAVEDCGQFHKIYARNLNVEMRLLHVIICWIIQPRAGGFDVVSEKDLVIMYHTVHCIPFNLPKLIIKTMQDAVTKAETSLPYSMILTHIFKYFGIRFEEEQSVNLGRGSKINKIALNRMQWFKINDQWIKKSGSSAQENISEISRCQFSRNAGPSTSAQQRSVQPRITPDVVTAIAREVASILESSSSRRGGESSGCAYRDEKLDNKHKPKVHPDYDSKS